MAIEKVKNYFRELGIENRVLEFETSSATVDLAANAAGVIPARIAKSLSFKDKEGAIIVVTAGDMRIDNKKFKDTFGLKAKMLTPDEVFDFTGHKVGGVCPFAIENKSAKIYLDDSMKRFETVFPACGSSNSAIELSCMELEDYSNSCSWVDVCKE